jgi:hypothetical protein
MSDRQGYDLDMRSDGSFVQAQRPGPLPGWRGGSATFRAPRGLGLVAVIAGSAIVAGIALSLALILVPIALGAALIGYAALRWQLWRMRRNGFEAKGFGPVMSRVQEMLRAQQRAGRWRG